MLLPVLGALALAAVPVAPKLAAAGFATVNVDSKKGDLFIEYFAQRLNRYGIRVTTKSEIGALLGLERQKQLLGCSDEASSCLAELGGALGVDGVISGTAGQVGSGYVLTLKVVRARDGTAMGSYSGRVDSEDAVLDWLARTAQTFATELGLAVEPANLRGKAWIPAAAGLVAAGVGAGFFVSSKGVETTLTAPSGSVDPGRLDSTIFDGRAQQNVGVALLGVGAVGFATAAVLYLVGAPQSDLALDARPLRGGAFVSATWSWP